MRKFLPILVATLVVSVSWIFFKNFAITGLNGIRIVPRQETEPAADLGELKRRLAAMVSGDRPRSVKPGDVRAGQAARLRIGTFNVNSLTTQKLEDTHVLETLARIGREFDVLALQDLRIDSESVFVTLVQAMNQQGAQFDYVVGPAVGPKENEDRFAFIYNRRTLLLDSKQVYTVDDRSQILTYEPLVGWFRSAASAPEQAFTFSLVNVNIDPSTAIQEHEILDDLFVAVRDDGRNEDDVILAGGLGAAPGQLGPLNDWQQARFAVSGLPTVLDGGTTLDNIVFHGGATIEFLGNGGVLDFMRQFNLSLEDALAVSDHLIVWAEFSVFEGGPSGQMAERRDDSRR